MKKLLILDFLNLFYRGFYTHMDLSHRGIHTGGLFGFIQQLVSHCKEINPSNIVICSDTYPYFRNDDYGDYKQDRRKVDKDKEILEKIQQGKSLCREFIKLTGIPFVEVVGLEADDLIAAFLFFYSAVYDQVIVSSNDSDLYQLLYYKNFSIYKGKGVFYTHSDFKEQFSPLPDCKYWNRVIAYSGGHNGLPGIPRVGERTAIKIVCNEELDIAFGKNNDSSYKRQKFEYRNQTELNLKLCGLPYYGFKEFRKIRIPDYGKYEFKEVIKMLRGVGVSIRDDLIGMLDKLYYTGTKKYGIEKRIRTKSSR